MTTPHRCISLLVCALGGEGGGVLSQWLVDIAREAGYPAQSTSIPGVAQRTGATTYYLEVFPRPMAALGGRRPVFSLNPVPGALDALVSSELLETTRQIAAGMSSPERTMVITSSARVLTTQERMPLGDGRADTAPWLQVVREFSRAHHVFDMGAVARDAGTIVSAVMLGAIAASGVLPFTREQFEAVVRRSGAGAPASLRGFARGFEMTGAPATTAAAARVRDDIRGAARDPASSGCAAETAPALEQLPASVREVATLGHARMLEYQDASYGALYLQRVQRVLSAERVADPADEHGCAATREAARWLALWMAFDDIVRVADLKSRASRWDRVRREVKAGAGDVLRVYDHFKPGAAEFAALLPLPLAQRVLRWDRARVARGKSPLALPLKIGAHSVAGMLSLRALAGLKWLRVRGSRYRHEQQLIATWLDAVAAGLARDWRLGHELALCGQLIKGYGTTNERGKANLLHVVEHLARGSDPAAAAQAIAAARGAALADEAGQAFDEALVRHGAPPRPVTAVPIRFVRRAPGKARCEAASDSLEPTIDSNQETT